MRRDGRVRVDTTQLDGWKLILAANAEIIMQHIALSPETLLAFKLSSVVIAWALFLATYDALRGDIKGLVFGCLKAAIGLVIVLVVAVVFVVGLGVLIWLSPPAAVVAFVFTAAMVRALFSVASAKYPR
jgi:hypothetical protein